MKSLNLGLEINQPGISIQADATRLAQVFDNLLVNAVKYAPGAQIMVSLDID